MRSYGPRPFNAAEYTDEEAATKTTQELLNSRCVFESQPDGTNKGLTGGARELMRRSDQYFAARKILNEIPQQPVGDMRVFDGFGPTTEH